MRITWLRPALRRLLLCLLAVALCVSNGQRAYARTVLVESLDEAVSLSGDWKFRAGDDPAWSHPTYDDSDWHELWVPKGWGQQGYSELRGVAWYRLELDLSGALAGGRKNQRLGVQLGEVTSSYELYAGRERIGGVGSLPPVPRMEYDRHRTYSIPLTSVAADGRLVLAIRVWKSSVSRTREGGPTRGPFMIGRVDDLEARALLDGLPQLMFALAFAAIGLYHIRIYAAHRGLAEHLWFGLFVLDVAAYSLLRTQWKYRLSDDFVLLKNLEYMAIYVLPALGIQMTASVFARPIGRWLRSYQLSHLALAALVGLTPGLTLNLMLGSLCQLWVLPTILYCGVVGIQEYRRGHPQADLAPALFFSATCLFDIAVDQDWIHGPRMIPVGMAVMILSMAASLTHRLIRTQKELESLSATLETRIDEQTFELRERSEQLEAKNRELEEVQGSLLAASLTDPLTGLSNRRFLTDYLDHDVARVLRDYGNAEHSLDSKGKTDLVFLLLDLDYFKEVNDHHGHDAGDSVLKKTADLLREVCRKSDYVVRWGGEEFLVVSRFVDRLGATILAERIRAAIGQHAFEIGHGVQLRQTCSIGFATFPLLQDRPGEFSWRDVVGIADHMLYAAKKNGRNGWVGVSGMAAESDDGLLRRLHEDIPGCLTRGDIECQVSQPDFEPDGIDQEKNELPASR